ncbi:retrovirus-related pol polyprotein from transposon TNT 1-94 [Tanacetum coccineum]
MAFFFWKARFETYVKSKDIDLWQVIQNGDFYFKVQDEENKLMKEMPYELLKDVKKKQLGKNEEANMTIYNALPRKKFSISNEEIIDSGFTRFNAIVTSLKSLDLDYSSKNHVRKFLCALPLKWRSKVTAIEEAKDLATLPLEELIGNLKVYEMVLDNDGVALMTTKQKVKPLALKAKVHDKFDIFQVRDKGGESSRREHECYNYGSMNHLASNFPKPNNKAFVRVTWSDSEDDDEPQNNATCLMAIDSQENIKEAIKDESRTMTMQEELDQSVRNNVWDLVLFPEGHTIIGSKWVFRNKLDENGIVCRNKARLVAQGYNQQEGIDYDETYALVARLDSIRILLTYACYYMFKLFQMDVKSAFLNGVIDEEVYVAQPPSFIDFQKPNHVYKIKKALYRLKQAPKAWKRVLTLDKDSESIGSTKYRGMIGSFLYLTGSRKMSNLEGSINKGEMGESSKKRKLETMKGYDGDERIMFEFILRGFAESEIWDKIKDECPQRSNSYDECPQRSLRLNEDEYSICCENTIHMMNALKEARMKSREMLLSIHHSLKMLLDIISNMNRKLEDEKIKRNDKGKEKVNDF